MRGVVRRFRWSVMRRNKKCKLGTHALMSAMEASMNDQMEKLAKFPRTCQYEKPE